MGKRTNIAIIAAIIGAAATIIAAVIGVVFSKDTIVFIESTNENNNSSENTNRDSSKTDDTNNETDYGVLSNAERPENNDNYSVFNADMLYISPCIMAVEIKELGLNGWGVMAYLNDSPIANIKLIDYSNNKIIEEQNVLLGDSYTFLNIPEGLYYYIIECEGYITYCSNMFQLKLNNSEKDVLRWQVGLKQKDGILSQPFKIQLHDSQKNVIKEATVYLRAISLQDNNYDVHSSVIMHPNEDGYLISSSAITEFQLCEGFLLEASIDNENFFQVNIQDDIGICIIQK